MYAKSFFFLDQSVRVEVPRSLRSAMETLFGHGNRVGNAKEPRRIVVREDGDGRFAIEAPFSKPVDGLGMADVLTHVLEEVVRSLVFELESQIALHAGAVGWKKKLVLVAGPSQAGKSSLVAWLASNGFDYLSDELVGLCGEAEAEAFSRPLIVKPGSRDLVEKLSLAESGASTEIGGNLAISPARSGARDRERQIGLIIFVDHVDGAELKIEALSGARCVSRLMGCNLNSRNFPDHGLGALRQLAKRVPAITLRYGSFDQLCGVVDRLIRLLFEEGFDAAEATRFLTAFGGTAAGGSVPVARATTEVPKSFPVPARTEDRFDRKLTIGMATYDDFDGVYFTIQALRLYHPEVMDDVEFLVIDNHPDGPCGEPLKNLEKSIDNYRYIPFTDWVATVAKGAVFEEASGTYVLCVDCHVLIGLGGVQRLLDYYDRYPDTSDLLQGPLIYDDLQTTSSHFAPNWGSGMYGKFSEKSDLIDVDAEPFEVPMQGMGLFSCRKDVWPGFNPAFRGFGGEEFYIHEKFRQAGGRTLCLPFLRWLHRFSRPMGVPYFNRWEDRIRNYMIGFSELGLPTVEMEEHFKELLGEGVASQMIAQIRQELDQVE